MIMFKKIVKNSYFLILDKEFLYYAQELLRILVKQNLQLRLESALKLFFTIICLILKKWTLLKQTHSRPKNCHQHQHDMWRGLQVYPWFSLIAPLEFYITKFEYLDIDLNYFQAYHVPAPVMSLEMDTETVRGSFKIDQSAMSTSLLAAQICKRVVRMQENVFQKKHVRRVTA